MKSFTGRNTKQRTAILSTLRGLRSHPTADVLFKLVRKKMPGVSLGTVYRNLKLLEKAGLIQKIVDADSAARYDATVEIHYHVKCLGCGRVDDIPMKPHFELEVMAAKKTGYRISGHVVEFSGVCPACRKTGE